MESTLTWLDLTSSDREKLRRILDLFKEKGTIDELGLGNLRDMFADALFPGVNTVQTRLRYVLFIPWIYKSLESRRASTNEDVDAGARKSEIRLIGSLERSDDSAGTIGVQARDSLVRLPSNIYWTALKQWGIFKGVESQTGYHKNFRKGGLYIDMSADDPGSELDSRSKWHLRLPESPNSFPRVASFKLKKKESIFLQGCLEESCKGTLLGWLAHNGSNDLEYDHLWETSAAARGSKDIREVIEHARRFSLHVEGMSILYNLLIAELRIEKKVAVDDAEHDAQRANDYRKRLGEWSAQESCETPYDLAALNSFILNRKQKTSYLQWKFLEKWSARIAKLGAQAIVDDKVTRDLIRHREYKLKNNRARLSNIERLRDWPGDVGIGRMEFRWYTARQLLKDLFEGLES